MLDEGATPDRIRSVMRRNVEGEPEGRVDVFDGPTYLRVTCASMRRLVLGAVLGAALAFIPSAATAMVNGTPDFSHTEAGALYFSDTVNGPKQFACSGALIDHTAFLTAAHCFADYYRANGHLPNAWATFDQKPTAASTYYKAGSIAIDPAFVPKLTSRQNVYADDTNDIAVLHLSADPGIQPAMLPTANELDTAPHGQTFDVLGYGSTVTFGGGAHTYPPPASGSPLCSGSTA